MALDFSGEPARISGAIEHRPKPIGAIMATKDRNTEIEVQSLKRDVATVNIIGRTPLIMNRLSEKAKHELLLPSPRKNAAEKASNLKHNPLAEFRSSPHRLRSDDAPTLLAMPTTAFKGALRSAALDVPGAAKSQIGRLTYVEGEYVPIYGIPQLLMSVVRSADMARTPDVRTRVIVPRWAATIRVHYVASIIKLPSVVNLLVQGGLTIGVGDWRPEKGSGTYGQFEICAPEMEQAFEQIVAEGGRAAQHAAMENPEAYDAETDELLGWFDVELRRRGFKVAA
jgi:hypothetical protein